MAIDMIVEGGHVVYNGDVTNTSIAIDEGKILAVGSKKAFPTADKVIDAKGKIVIPGGVDPHTHFVRLSSLPETWTSGTKAAAFGGTTTIVDFAYEGRHGETPVAAVKNQLEDMKAGATIDYTTHAVLTDFSHMEQTEKDIEEIVKMGVAGFKLFMINGKHGHGDLSDWDLLRILQISGEKEGMVAIHAENDAIAKAMQERLVNAGKVDYKYHAEAKPNLVEMLATQRALSVTESAHANMYIAHMSTKESVNLLRTTKERDVWAWGETCPHYLTITEDIYDTDLALYSLCSPPFRKQADIQALWKGLRDGTISTVGSDHVCYTKAVKEKENQRFTDVPNGTPQVEVRLPILYSEGVTKDRLSLPRFVDLVSTNPAKLLGLYPQKGVIAPGADADIVIIDPELQKVLNHEQLHMDVDWSLYQGMEVKGWPVTTILRGKVIVKDEQFVGELREGQFVEGALDDEILQSM